MMMKWMVGILCIALAITGSVVGGMSAFNQEKQPERVLPPAKYTPAKEYDGDASINNAYRPPANTPGLEKWDLWGQLRVRVVDERTGKPLKGAEVVLAENGYRTTTDRDGWTKVFPAPVIRDPRYSDIIQRLHGQLTLVVYRNGYRDSIMLGVRMREGMLYTPVVGMYQITPGDRRIEPTVFKFPTHHIFATDLAEFYRRDSQPGEGYESPDLNR
jgi:hypothetical protein